MKIVNIVQARMTSSRFPGKMMAILEGKPIIEWVLERCKISELTNQIILAVPNELSSKSLLAEADKLQIRTHLGSKNNVLERYFRAGIENNADIVVRTCGDRPFVDPKIIDLTINEYLKNINNNTDIVFSHKSSESEWWPYGFGVEVFSMNFLEKIIKITSNKEDLEHVTLHAWNNKDKFKIKELPCPSDYQGWCKDMKLDLDTNDDYLKLQKIISEINNYSIDTPGSVIIKYANKLRIK